jgi:hypothetical protein
VGEGGVIRAEAQSTVFVHSLKIDGERFGAECVVNYRLFVE